MNPCPYCASSLPDGAATCPTCGAMLGSPALPIGSLIAQKYRLEEVLGQGGFGITYLAFDTVLEHRVAIKELFPEGSARRGIYVVSSNKAEFAETKQKFLQEARVVQRFSHPNIVRVYGTFEENETAYIVMEALEGQSLRAYVTAFGAMPEDDLLHFVSQLCSALERVHASGLLHRDLKPDNVMLTGDGRAVLLDFGSARDFVQGQERKHTRFITPGFAPPEQYASQANFGTYTDVYALAATVYFALEGHAPPDALDRLNGTPLPEPKNAIGFRHALYAGLELRVTERTQTVTAFKAQLEASPEIGERLRNLAAATPQFIISIGGVDVHGDRLVTPDGVFYTQDFDGFLVEVIAPDYPPDQDNQVASVGAWMVGISFISIFIVANINPSFGLYPMIGVAFGMILTFLFGSPPTTSTSIPPTTWKVALTRASSQQAQAESFPLVNIEFEADLQNLESHLARFLPKVA
jgi:serine/threonine protein kinase